MLALIAGFIAMLLSTAPACGQPTEGDARLVQAALLYEQGRYDDAADIVERAVTEIEQVAATDHSSVGEFLAMLAMIRQAQGREADAAPLYQRALAIREHTLGPNHPRVQALLASYAAALRKVGNAAEAEAVESRVRTIQQLRDQQFQREQQEMVLGIDLQEGFTGETTQIFINGVQVYIGQPTTNPALGLAEGIPVYLERPATFTLRVKVLLRTIDQTFTIDPAQGTAIGLSIVQGKLELQQQASGFYYE